MRLRLALLALIGLLALGCKRLSEMRTGRATATSPPSGSGDAGRGKPSMSAGAFELVAANGGAALVWADRESGMLMLSVLNDAGKTVRREPLLPGVDGGARPDQTSISELAATARGAELGVAWLERGATARARGFVRPLNGDSGGEVVELGAVQEPVSMPRGNLAVTDHDGHFSVLARGAKSDCIDRSAHDCVSFGFHRLDVNGGASQGLPMTVPLPCAQNSVSFAVTSSRWYYGVCSQSTGKPVTTLFSIQPDPEYARADQLLEGCLPLGALAENGELWLVGDCAGEGQRHGVRVRGGNAEIEDLRVDRLEAVCQSGSPLIRQTGPAGMILPLLAPRDRLEAFLPPELAPANARAVWTGRTLLVATPGPSSITLRGYQCDSTLLREVPVALPTAAAAAK